MDCFVGYLEKRAENDGCVRVLDLDLDLDFVAVPVAVSVSESKSAAELRSSWFRLYLSSSSCVWSW